MRFCNFLKIMNCYIGQDKSQYDFMFLLFSQIICEPFSEEDVSKDEEDRYYPFSKLCGGSQAKKVYSGERILPKALARFVRSHYEPTGLIEMIENMSDVVKGNLCDDITRNGIECNIDNVSDIVADIFKKFLDAAMEENDVIESKIKAECTTSIQCGAATNNDVLLLEETGNICPICGCSLLQIKKSNVIRKYKVVKIFPENLTRELYLSYNKVSDINGRYESQDNKIALCTDCALDYESGTSIEAFDNLLRIKKNILQKSRLRQSVEKIDIEDEISVVISELNRISVSDDLVLLNMKALRIEQKIEGKYGLLINDISYNVVRYYKFIEEQFRIADSIQSNTFERVAGEVKLAYEKMEGNGMSQERIYEELTEWMLRKLKFENRYRPAVEIVISFFVQNCEVFHEITK